MTRRQVLKAAGLAGAAMAVPWELLVPRAVAADAPGTPGLTHFLDALPAAIPVLRPSFNPQHPFAAYYEISMRPGSWKFHSQLPTTGLTWGYWGTGVSAGPSGPVGLGYLGPTIDAVQGIPVVVKFINELTGTHPVQDSIDYTIAGNDPGMFPIGRATPHLHGGFTPPQFDGHPWSWWAPNGQRDPNWAAFGYPTLPGAVRPNEMKVWYSNQQPPAGLWYHDHAMGITRLNAYAGLAALYFIRNLEDTGLQLNLLGLPGGPYEVPLVLQDKQFNSDGSLFYPTTSGQLSPPYPHPKWVPEFFADTPVINATAYPFLNVEPRRYRFRMVNGSQARFFNLSLEGGIPLWVIGMEQSLLPAPAKLAQLLLAPGERADVIVDFTGLAPGTNIVLENDANAPYPDGGGGPAIPELMRFQVVPLKGRDGSVPPDRLRLPALVGSLLPAAATAPKRQIIMKELADANDVPIEMKLNERHFEAAPEDNPRVGSTEVWQWINLTVDAHPMHMHLVKFQVVDRQPFDPDLYWQDYSAWVAAGRQPGRQPDVNGLSSQNTAYLTGPAQGPAPEESGWKDTVKAYPRTVTRTIAKFDVHDPSGGRPTSTRLPAEYVYHCHILEHEENDMMRRFQVVS